MPFAFVVGVSLSLSSLSLAFFSFLLASVSRPKARAGMARGNYSVHLTSYRFRVDWYISKGLGYTNSGSLKAKSNVK